MFPELNRAATAAMLLMTALNSGAVEIIAHRGASHDAPENTLAAMKEAWAQKADAIELDIWLSKDERIIVMHDSDTKRVGGPARKIVDQTWAELENLDVGAYKDPKFKGERLPTIESILSTVPPGRRAVIEIKCGPEILPALGRALEQSGRKSNELAIISFNFEALRQSKEKFPHLAHYFLHGYKQDPTTGRFPELAPLMAQAKGARFDGLNLQFNWPIDKALVDQVKSAGLQMFVWTVNDAAVAKRLVDAGVDGITTDRPGWMREQLKLIETDR